MEKNIVKAPKIRAPKGYKFKITRDRGRYRDKDEDFIHVSLLNSLTNYEVGHIELEKSSRRWVTHSDLDPSLHGKGIGIVLYAKAIQYCHRKGLRVSSSGYSSMEAQRLWASKRLRKLFRIVKRYKSYYYDFDQKKKGMGDPTWFAYPLNK